MIEMRTQNEPTLWRKLDRKSHDSARLARDLVLHPDRLVDALGGLDADRARVRFGCAKLLRIVADEHPELLYPHFPRFRRLLDSDNRIMRWEAIHVIGRLGAVDTGRRIDRILDRLLAPLCGPDLVTAANTIDAAGHIAVAKPYLADRIDVALRTVSRGRYKTPECREVALGAVVDALDRLADLVSDATPLVRFVRRLRESPRPATRKKAERFLASRSRR
ncbi:MAG: hypothetical protein IPM29_24165 [Planctomycetes bacterium]|nr:hypothetical protein [Planctomycetota bacterium]